MTALPAEGAIEIGEHALEYRWFGPAPAEAPTLVLLHEGLGSAQLWGGFPAALAAATGTGVMAYSRAGYGASSPVPLPRPFSYMHDEALDVLPRVLDAIGFRRGLLVGSSDGASIATIFAGQVDDERVRGLVLMAPHFFLEDAIVAGATAAKLAYETSDLRSRLARWHDHVDVAFHGWNQAWLDPAFRGWNITEALPRIRVPIHIIQGATDEYGTMRQVEAAEDSCFCPVSHVLMPGIGHQPWREAAAATVADIAAFAAPLLRDD